MAIHLTFPLPEGKDPATMPIEEIGQLIAETDFEVWINWSQQDIVRSPEGLRIDTTLFPCGTPFTVVYKAQ